MREENNNAVVETAQDLEQGNVQEKSKQQKRENRRRRRLRSQMFAYLIVLVLITVSITGLVWGIKKVSAAVIDHQTQKDARIAASESSENTEIAIITPDDEEVPLASEADEIVNNRIDATLLNMTLEEKAAYIFFITPEQLTGVDSAVKAGSSTQAALEQYTVGGIVYSSNNIKSDDQIKEMLATTSQMSRYPLLLAVSEEGGSKSVAATSLGITGTKAPSLLEGSDDAAQNAGALGSYLINYGFNMNLAPNLKLSDAENLFGTDANLTAQMASAYISSLETTGVSACASSFPVAVSDPASGLETCDLSIEELQAGTFVPFECAIDAGVDAIMVSNIACPSISGEGIPCSLSGSAITDTLRGNLGYDGIVITDAMNVPAITDAYTSDQAAVAAIIAGADMIFMPEDFQAAYNGIIEAVNTGIITEERLNESVRRILRVRYTYDAM
ncbi:glycoside hydrolase family 3 N-terminal domain-containing protein [Butyrivibrio sp. TB]|uniref:glycoside hydrolase family 3 N-terminal domain-containing protein n=1 Tax=Butyrivibrio sp. TB TaxID=1520809 RepID=UPI0008C5A366|nr:glycoside hydrolase family 3 N-terminal domain-containing protein [Butyrivibrio sp. TB]SEQ48470.1 beta-N-acetylhexosaminidase [Butyrivibrio sp. TB]